MSVLQANREVLDCLRADPEERQKILDWELETYCLSDARREHLAGHAAEEITRRGAARLLGISDAAFAARKQGWGLKTNFRGFYSVPEIVACSKGCINEYRAWRRARSLEAAQHVARACA